VRKLEISGYILRYEAILSASKLDYSLSAFCTIGLRSQSDSDLKAFSALTQGWPIVRKAWMISGESDFLLYCVAEDLKEFQSFVVDQLAKVANVETVRSMLTINMIKDLPDVRLDRLSTKSQS
jgi:DNA-binding Lrp family transcriptional regulator